MDKPKEAIERMRQWRLPLTWMEATSDSRAILAWADSIPEGAVPVVWPAELTRDRLEILARYAPSANGVARALYELSAIAPERKKRVVNLWAVGDGTAARTMWCDAGEDVQAPWRKVNKEPVELED